MKKFQERVLKATTAEEAEAVFSDILNTVLHERLEKGQPVPEPTVLRGKEAAMMEMSDFKELLASMFSKGVNFANDIHSGRLAKLEKISENNKKIIEQRSIEIAELQTQMSADNKKPTMN